MTSFLNKAGLIFLLLVCAQSISPARAAYAGSETYLAIRLIMNGPSPPDLPKLGIYPDHISFERNGTTAAIRLVLSKDETQTLRDNGIPFEIISDDLSKKHQLDLKRKKQAHPDQFSSQFFDLKPGSMGGFFTLQEVENMLDSLHLRYPDLISAKTAIGTSIEQRPIWMIKISDQPDLDEDEPEALYTSLLHAREPQSMMTLMYFIVYLLENYGIRDEVTWLLDHRELYFLPVVNPDGYVYNEKTNPDGGGGWRKNRRKNDDNSFGVDLNRNFDFKWGYSNTGSSPHPTSNGYRGKSPFSEPETAALQLFCNTRQFKLALNYHSYSNLLIYPWEYTESPLTPDSLLFFQYGQDMTRFTKYTYGNAWQAIGYRANGASDDWMYGDTQLREKIISMTPEVGNYTDGFWPTLDRIPELAQENVHPNMYLAKAAGGFIKTTAFSWFESGGRNGFVDPGESVKVVINLKNVGLSEAENIHFQIKAGQGLVVHPPATTTISRMLPGAEVESDTFALKIDGSFANGAPLQLISIVNANGLVQADTTQDLIIGTPAISLQFDGESGTDFWTGRWGISETEAFEGDFSFTDSPTGASPAKAATITTLRNPIDLTDANVAHVEFWTKWDIEPNFDYGLVLASKDSVNWVALPGKLTRLASIQDGDYDVVPIFAGKQINWVQERMDLSAFAGEPRVFLRFVVKNSVFEPRDGWYIDALKIKTYKGLPVGTNSKVSPPKSITLNQNYPNPFNPKTRITFAIPASGHVSFIIYDLLGRQVSTLIDGHISSGTHEIIFDASQLPGGLYFYRLQSGTTTKTKKMVLLR